MLDLRAVPDFYDEWDEPAEDDRVPDQLTMMDFWRAAKPDRSAPHATPPRKFLPARILFPWKNFRAFRCCKLRDISLRAKKITARFRR